MPQRKSGIKELRVSRKKHLRNLDIKTDLKKTIKKFKSIVDAKKTDEAKTLLSTVYKKLDKAAKRNVLKKNTAARRKSYFNRLLLSIKN